MDHAFNSDALVVRQVARGISPIQWRTDTTDQTRERTDGPSDRRDQPRRRVARFVDNFNPLLLLDPRRTARNVGAVVERHHAHAQEVEAVVARVSEAKQRHPSSGPSGGAGTLK